MVERKDAAGGYPFQDAIDIPAAAGDEALKILAEAGYAMFQLLFRHDAADSQCIGIGDWLVRQAGDARSVLKLQVVGAEFPVPWALRSEEHTSELQSLMRLSFAVFWLKT